METITITFRNQRDIDHYAPYGKTNPIDIVFDMGTTSVVIPPNKFYGDRRIRTVTFLNHVKKIGENAFRDCEISLVQFEEGFDFLQSHCFATNPLTVVRIDVKQGNRKKSRWVIDRDAFYHCGEGEEQLAFEVNSYSEAIEKYAAKNGFHYINTKKRKPSRAQRRIEPYISHEPIITTKGMNVVFRNWMFGRKEKRVLDNVDISIHQQEMIMIVGGSGCGKSTLIKQLFGLEKCNCKNDVTVSIGGKTATGKPFSQRVQKLLFRKIYYAPQFMISNEDLTVKQEIQKNSMMFRGVKYDLSSLAELAKDHHLLDENYTVDEKHTLDEDDLLLNTKVGKISGGQKKKLLVACSDAMDPLVYIFDEPDSGLDEPSAFNLYISTLRNQQVDKEGKTVIVISHHPRRVMTDFTRTQEKKAKEIPFDAIFTRLIVLAKHKDETGKLCGTIAFDGPPKEALKFFELPESSPYNVIISKIMTKADGGASSQDKIDDYVRSFRKQKGQMR